MTIDSYKEKWWKHFDPQKHSFVSLYGGDIMCDNCGMVFSLIGFGDLKDSDEKFDVNTCARVVKVMGLSNEEEN